MMMLKITIEGVEDEGQTAIAHAIGQQLRDQVGMHVAYDPASVPAAATLPLEHALKLLEAKAVTIEIRHVRADTIEARVNSADLIAVKSASGNNGLGPGYHIIKNRYGRLGHVTQIAFELLKKSHPEAKILVV
jgi:hypothetical protein